MKRNRTRWLGFCALLAVVMACRAEFRVNTYTTDDQQYPAIAGNGSGDFVIAWECDGQNGVYGQRLAANGVFLGNEFRIGSGGEPDVAMDAAGNFVVTWEAGDASQEGIYARLYDANGQPLTEEFPVNTYTDSRQLRPGVAMNNTGEFVITWQSEHNPGHHSYTTGRKYNANGVPYGPEFLITWVTHGHRPDVVIDDSGDFVVAWLPIEGDYHLQSQGGRWDPNRPSAGTWVRDDVTSLCIDAGDMRSPIGHEPFPNGGIINMGAYGGTPEASKSYFAQPVCEIIVAGDINGDCIVDFRDFFFIALHWLEDYNP